jgi:CBS domain-containing protein
MPQTHPKVFELLKRTDIRELMDTIPQPLFKPSSTMLEIGRAFASHPHELFYVCAEGDVLKGVITMTDWLRALSRGARPETPIAEAMTPHPIAVSTEDNGSVAAAVLREHRLKNLPVISNRADGKLVGYLRTRRLMAHVFSNVGAAVA